ncbi:MAG: CDP-glycerol glycerophosphotransferase family protein [Lachnospiraceae bacterium]|nr:CDP-glycerol glycerophosphotransferase family protein [Lachnospiraceae bacterium]
MNIKLFLKQYVKMAAQKVVLPVIYRRWRGEGVDPKLVILADAHHNERPENMRLLYEALKAAPENYHIREMYLDYGRSSAGQVFRHMADFMKWYARASSVVICDNFLPAAGCRKRPETQVIQLWHACGSLKRFGYDTTGDIPANYRGNVFRNTDVVTVSAPACVPAFAGAMRLPREAVQPLGVSRTDRYADPAWAAACREKFERLYPQAAGRKIVLWAPTFRGSPGAPVVELPDLERLSRELGEETRLIVRLHPHMKEAAGQLSAEMTAEGMTTEELFAVTDVLIADYSSLIFEYLLFGGRLVRYAPDLEHYIKERGFYLDYSSIPGELVLEEPKLAPAVRRALETEETPEEAQKRKQFLQRYMSACDGHATQRVAELIRKHGESIR